MTDCVAGCSLCPPYSIFTGLVTYQLLSWYVFPTAMKKHNYNHSNLLSAGTLKDLVGDPYFL